MGCSGRVGDLGEAGVERLLAHVSPEPGPRQVKGLQTELAEQSSKDVGHGTRGKRGVREGDARVASRWPWLRRVRPCLQAPSCCRATEIAEWYPVVASARMSSALGESVNRRW